MTKQPSIPRSKTNPVGQTRRIQRAKEAYNADVRAALDLVLRTVDSWPVTVQNGRTLNRAFYEYLIDLNQLTSLVDAISGILRNGSGPDAVRQAAESSYREGIAKAVENLTGLSDDYTRTVLQRLGDQFVLRRAALAGSRAFESMTGFADQTARDLARILFQAIQNGISPTQVAKDIRERFRVSRSRAERIARTEITGALRRGRMDEARDAEEKLGMKVRLLHVSALIPGRTRRTHARRHGRLVTVEEQADWYTRDGNAINCLCSSSEVVVDENEEPIFGEKLIERMSKSRQAFLKTTADEAAA